MDKEKLDRAIKSAEENAFDSALISLRVNNAALVAVVKGMQREHFLQVAGNAFDDMTELRNKAVDAELERLQPSKVTP